MMTDLNMTRSPVRFRFHFVVTKTFGINGFSGAMFRGLLGHALMTRPGTARTPSAYAHFFEPDNHHQHTAHARFVVESSHLELKTYTPGDRLHIDIVVMGPDNAYLLEMIRALHDKFQTACIGADKGAVQLHLVEAITPGQCKAIWTPGLQRLMPYDLVFHTHINPVSSCRLTFLSPALIKHQGRFMKPDNFDLRGLLNASVRRFVEHCPDADTARLQVLCEQPYLGRQALAWYSSARYSNRQKQSIPVEGLVGSIDIHGLPPGLMLPLEAGQWLHIGKNISMGLGQYQLENTDPVTTAEKYRGQTLEPDFYISL
jgi:hypothetical protein